MSNKDNYTYISSLTKQNKTGRMKCPPGVPCYDVYKSKTKTLTVGVDYKSIDDAAKDTNPVGGFKIKTKDRKSLTGEQRSSSRYVGVKQEDGKYYRTVQRGDKPSRTRQISERRAQGIIRRLKKKKKRFHG